MEQIDSASGQGWRKGPLFLVLKSVRGTWDGDHQGSSGSLSQAALVCSCFHAMIAPPFGECEPELRRMIEFSMKDQHFLASFLCRPWCGALIGSDIEDDIMSELASTVSLATTKLHLARCEDLTNTGIKHLVDGLMARGPPWITLLDLHDCYSLTDTGIKLLAGLSSLKSLQLDNMRGVTDLGVFQVVIGCPNLIHLDLCGCSITDLTLICLGTGLRRLRDLGLVGCELLTDNGIRFLLIGCPDLTEVDIDGCYGLTHAGILHMEQVLAERRGARKSSREWYYDLSFR